MDLVTRAYLACALWTATDGERGEIQLEDHYDLDDFADESVVDAAADCARFVADNQIDLEELSDEDIGHNFWLTRNGHGTGFWDRGLGAVGDRLTAACKPYGERYVYVGDDNKLYIG